MSIEGDGIYQHFGSEVLIYGIRWSPAGDTIAYHGIDAKGIRTLHFVDPSTQSEFYSSNMGVEASMIWSPDGRYVIVTGPGYVGTIDAMSFEKTDLVSNGAGGFWPVGWSPDAKKLLIGGSCCGLRGFFYVDIDQPGHAYSVTAALMKGGVYTTADPAWAPDQDVIAFSAYRGCRCP